MTTTRRLGDVKISGAKDGGRHGPENGIIFLGLGVGVSGIVGVVGAQQRSSKYSCNS